MRKIIFITLTVPLLIFFWGCNARQRDILTQPTIYSPSPSSYVDELFPKDAYPRNLPPFSLTVEIRKGMTYEEVKSILGPPHGRVSDSLLEWELYDPAYVSIASSFYIGFDLENQVDYMSCGGGGNPTIDINVYHH